MARIEGGCLCGAVRYRSDFTRMQVVCHCKTCQKCSGSAFSMNVAVPQGSLITQGNALRIYIDRSGASGLPYHRYFCGNCGSPLFSHGAAYGELAFIKAGTLDDATWLAPAMHVWCAEKLLGFLSPKMLLNMGKSGLADGRTAYSRCQSRSVNRIALTIYFAM